jgi:hypothetical protein
MHIHAGAVVGKLEDPLMIKVSDVFINKLLEVNLTVFSSIT